MSTRRGVIAGLSVLAFVAAAFVLYSVKSMAQVMTINASSTACAQAARANPSDRDAMTKCLQQRGMVTVEDRRSGAAGANATATPYPADPYTACLHDPSVKKYEPKSSSWATKLQTCIDNAGGTAVVTMTRNPSTGEIEFGVSH